MKKISLQNVTHMLTINEVIFLGRMLCDGISE